MLHGALQIHFHGMPTSAALESRIRDRTSEIERLCPEATSCRVTVEKEARAHQKGNPFRVSLQIHLPGHDIVVTRQGPKDQGHADPHVAVRDAFDAALRQLKELRDRREEAKTTDAAPLQGQVSRLFAEQDYGFVTLPGGPEVYFHRNSVSHGDFDGLSIGAVVRVVMADGEGAMGPQAATVRPIGKATDES